MPKVSPQYQDELTKIPVMPSDDESYTLLTTEDFEARDRVIHGNLRLVVKLAKSFQHRGLDLEDLVAEGNVGLVRAIEHYDPTRKTKFSTYAAWWIKQAIHQSLETMGSMCSYPSYMYPLVKKYQRAKNSFKAEFGYEPNEKELAAILEMSDQNVADICRAIVGVTDIEPSPQAAEQTDKVGFSSLASQREPNPVDALEEKETSDLLPKMVSLLDPETQTILTAHFEQDMNISDISRTVGYDRNKVGRIIKYGLLQLRNMFERGIPCQTKKTQLATG